MTTSEPFDEEKPNPELQAANGGPSGPGKTAVGTGSHNDEPDSHPFVPTKASEWFAWLFPMTRALIRRQLEPLTPKSRREYCENAMLTDDELTMLKIRWHINLNLDWEISGDAIKHFASTESDLEHQSVWKLWSYTLWRWKIWKGWWLGPVFSWCSGLAVIWVLIPSALANVKNTTAYFLRYAACPFYEFNYIPLILIAATVLWTVLLFKWLPLSLYNYNIASLKKGNR